MSLDVRMSKGAIAEMTARELNDLFRYGARVQTNEWKSERTIEETSGTTQVESKSSAESIPNRLQIDPKSSPNQAKIESTSVRADRERFGALPGRSGDAPGRPQDAPVTSRDTSGPLPGCLGRLRGGRFGSPFRGGLLAARLERSPNVFRYIFRELR